MGKKNAIYCNVVTKIRLIVSKRLFVKGNCFFWKMAGQPNVDWFEIRDFQPSDDGLLIDNEKDALPVHLMLVISKAASTSPPLLKLF